MPLSLGDPSSGYNRTLQMEIVDGYGSTVAVNLIVQVLYISDPICFFCKQMNFLIFLNPLCFSVNMWLP